MAFRQSLLDIRRQQDWTQAKLARVLAVSERTLSGWESAYWLPSFKQRLHVVLSMRNLPPERVLQVADALGVSADEAVAPFLQPFRDALDPPPPPADPAPPPPPAPVAAPLRIPVDARALRDAIDAVVRTAADDLDVRPGDLRAVLKSALVASSAHGATVEDIAAALAVAKKRPAATTDEAEPCDA
jgi:transcriptional regulator with XRE-family HTH domain